MKVFTYWRQKKSRKMDNNATRTAAESSCGSSVMQTAPQQQLQAPAAHDQLCGVRFSGTRPVDDDQHPQYLPHSFHGSHYIKSLQNMLCPIYSSDLLNYKKSIEKNSDATSTTDYDMDLLIYQYALQNAILSIGTFGGEPLSKMAAEMDNENIISTLGVSLVDNDLLEVAKPEKYICAHLLTTEKHASDVGDEGSLVKEIHIKGANASNPSSKHLTEEIMKKEISSIKTDDKVQVEMLRPCNNTIDQEFKCAKSTISSALQEELKKQQYLDHQPGTYVAGNRTDYHNIEDEIDKNQHLLTFMSGELDVNEKVVIGHGKQNNMDELNVRKSTTMKEFLKGLYMLEEVTQEVDSDEEASKCRSGQGLMGPSRSTKDMMGSSRNAEGIMGSSLRNAQLEGIIMGFSAYPQELVGSSSNAQKIMAGSSSAYKGILGSSSNAQEGIMGSSRSDQGMMGSPISSSSAQGILMGSSKNTKGASTNAIMGSSPSVPGTMCSSKLLSAHGIMGSSKNAEGIVGSRAEGMIGSSSSAQKIVHSSTDRVKGIRGFEQARSTKPKENIIKNDGERDDENIATHNNCMKLASTCNHHMDLKRLIIAVTPNYLAKHLLKRLKLGHRRMQMDRPDCKNQCKFYKLLRMLGMKQSRRSSNIMKRELGPLALRDVQISSKEDIIANNEQEFFEEETSCSSFHSNNMFIPSNHENWISTDDEYVVLELEAVT